MSELNLDPEGYFSCELTSGDLRYRDGGGRLVAFPLEALARLASMKIPEIERTLPYTLGQQLGEHCGRKVRASLGDDFLDSDTTPETFLDHLNAVLALHGLGLASLETWGDILLVRWKLDDGADDGMIEFQEGTVSGLLRALTDEPFEATALDLDADGTWILVGNARMVDRTRLWLGEGCAAGEIVERLHRGEHLGPEGE